MQGHKKRVSAGQNLRFACAKLPADHVRFAFWEADVKVWLEPVFFGVFVLGG